MFKMYPAPITTRLQTRAGQRRLWRLKVTLTLLAALVLLAACTTTFMYRNLDWLIPWYVDGMVDISRGQKAQLRERLEPLLQWHREEELRRYLVLLDHVESDLRDELSAGQVRAWVDEAIAAIERVESRFLDLAMEFAGELSDEQIREFADSLWEQQEEYEREFLPRSDEEYVEESIEYLSGFTRRFLPPKSNPSRASMALSAGSAAISTNPKPRGRPVSRSLIRVTLTTSPN